MLGPFSVHYRGIFGPISVQCRYLDFFFFPILCSLESFFTENFAQFKKGSTTDEAGNPNTIWG